MKLFYSPASPFARKVLVCAAEAGVAVETIPAAASPVARDLTVVGKNPLGKIPVAMLEDGAVLYDSRVICQWIGRQPGGEMLYPDSIYFDILRREALADGVMDALILSRYETVLRPEALRWDDWLHGQGEKVGSGLAAMEQEVLTVAGFDAGAVATACALGYLDFRFPDLNWRDGRPALTEWFDTVSARGSMDRTRPQ